MSNVGINPYNAPQASLVPQTAPGRIWRQGDLLVVQKGSNLELPDRCVKCNAPAEGRRLRRKLYWHHPALFLLVLLNLILYAIVAMAVRKSADLRIGICERHLARRRQATVTGWMLALAGLALVIIGAARLQKNEAVLYAVITGASLIVGGVVFGIVGSNVVTAKKIDEYFAWVKGVCPEYLAELPDIYEQSAPMPMPPVATPQIIAEPPAGAR